MKPNFSQAAVTCKKMGLGQFAAIDSTKNTESADKYGITGFPTLKLFSNGRFKIDYHGSRTTDSLIKFMENNKPKDEL